VKNTGSSKDEKGFAWFLSESFSIQRGVLLALVPITFFTLFSLTSWRDEINNGLVRVIEYRVRHWLKLDPKLDPRIKIYAIDDSTLNQMQKPDLSVAEWHGVFRAIGERNPRAVFVDKIFSFPQGLEALPKGFRFEPFSFPLIVGAFLTPKAIPGRPLLPINGPDFDLNHWDPKGTLRSSVNRAKLYGPHPIFQPWFSHLGHIVYPGHLNVYAWQRIDEKTLVPHATLFTAQERKIENGRVVVDGHPVPTDNEGKLLVNLADPGTYYGKAVALRSVLNRVKDKEPLSALAEGSVVVILPGFSTGDTDFVSTPYGSIPGGLVMTALINSVLTNQWLTSYSQDWPATIGLGVLGAVLGWKLGALSLILSLLGLSVLAVAGSLALFVFGSVEVSWFLPVLSFLSSGALIFAEKTRRRESRNRRLKETLDGVVSPVRLLEILQHPSSLELEPAERVVTTLFIDIAGFSLLAERQSPREAFLKLRELLSLMTAVVHRHGGVVDKTLGDGMLCFFGYNYDKTVNVKNHAQVAIECASAVQRELLVHGLKSLKERQPIYLVRIGINTSPVYLGDLGNPLKLDLTLIGDGVNFAKRVESACEPQRVLFSSGTYESLNSETIERLQVEKRSMKIKHHTESFVTFEVNPLREDEIAARRVRRAADEQAKSIKKSLLHGAPARRKRVATSKASR